MNIQQVIYVMKVHEYHSFTEAAKSLFISQPRLSQAIRELEEELGFDIFVRNRKGISGATERGKEFIAQSRILLRQFSALEALKEGNSATFNVSSFALTHAQDAFSALCKEYRDCPLLHMDFWLSDIYETVERVISMASEVGIIAMIDDSISEWDYYFKANNVLYHELNHSNVYVTLSKQSLLAVKDILCIDDLKGHTYIADNCSRNHSNAIKITALLSKLDSGAKIITSNTDMMYSTLAADPKAFIFDPFPLNQRTLDKYGLVSIPFEEIFKVRVGYISLAERELSSMASRYIELLKSEMN